MSQFHSGQRDLQDRFDSRRLADRLEQTVIHDLITPDDRNFIESREFFFLASVDPHGQPTCSFKGGAPGFVTVVDEKTLAFPCYDGNGMFMSMGNLRVCPQLGLLFIDFERPNRLRVNGRARIDLEDPLMRHYHEAQFIVRVDVAQVFPNCPRYIPRMQRVDASPHLPEAGRETPVAQWKQIDFLRDVLPACDQPRVAELPSITIEEFLSTLR